MNVHGTIQNPERDLMAAVVNLAIEDATQAAVEPDEKQEQLDAMRWIASETEEQGSLAWYCRHLGLDPRFVRDRVNIETGSLYGRVRAEQQAIERARAA